MDYIFDDWKKVLSDFQNSVEKDLAEIHKQKEAVQQMKTDIFERLDNGQYIYDEHRIVLSGTWRVSVRPARSSAGLPSFSRQRSIPVSTVWRRWFILIPPY